MKNLKKALVPETPALDKIVGEGLQVILWLMLLPLAVMFIAVLVIAIIAIASML